MRTFRTGDTDQEDTFLWFNDGFSGVNGIERIFVVVGGNRLSVFNELALLCVIVFLVITGANLIFALPFPNELLLPTLRFAICLSILAIRRPLSKLSISSNCENMSAEKVGNKSILNFNKQNQRNQRIQCKPGICSFSM